MGENKPRECSNEGRVTCINLCLGKVRLECTEEQDQQSHRKGKRCRSFTRKWYGKEYDGRDKTSHIMRRRSERSLRV